MRVTTRSLWVAFLALIGAVGLTVAWTMTTAVQLQAVTALIMGGTDHPLGPPKDQPPFVTAYLNNAIDGYINPAAAAGTGTNGPATNAVAVITPEEFFPIFGSKTFDQSVAEGRANLRKCLAASISCSYNTHATPTVGSVAPAVGDEFIVFGYSQSAVIASLEKQYLIDNYQPGDPTTSFLYVANAMRPNGGILMRGKGLPTIPFFGITFYGAAPTNGPVDDNGTPNDPTDDTFVYPTVDVAQQYDGLGGDFPYRPLNLLATINALAGYYYLHGNVVNRPLGDALYQGKEGDTTYYLFATDLLPVLMPLQRLGIPKPLLQFLDAPLRVLVEDAYLRGVSPGVPTAASILPIGNPIALALNLLASIPVGIDNALEGFGLGRPLGTTAPGPFGVGGPPLPDPPSTTMATTMSILSEPVDEDNKRAAEPVVSEADSLVGEGTTAAATSTVAEPATTPGTGTGESGEAKVTSVESTQTTTAPSGSTSQPQAGATTPDTNNPPAATEPERPQVRGPIEFDAPKRPKVRGPIEFNAPQRPTESPSTTPGEQSSTGEPTKTETSSSPSSNSTDSENSEHKDAA